MAIVVRCTGCTAEYARDRVPQTCLRCGTSAGWCQIHRPDEFSAAADAVLADVGREVTAEDRAAAMRQKMLGEQKAPGVCSQDGCSDKATHRFTWPGNPERYACPVHAAAAVRIAQVMGFFLEVPALEPSRDDDAPATPRDMPIKSS